MNKKQYWCEASKKHRAKMKKLGYRSLNMHVPGDILDELRAIIRREVEVFEQAR